MAEFLGHWKTIDMHLVQCTINNWFERWNDLLRKENNRIYICLFSATQGMVIWLTPSVNFSPALTKILYQNEGRIRPKLLFLLIYQTIMTFLKRTKWNQCTKTYVPVMPRNWPKFTGRPGVVWKKYCPLSGISFYYYHYYYFIYFVQRKRVLKHRTAQDLAMFWKH